MMIKSAEEFLRLNFSDDPEEQDRASWEEADISVWYEVLKQYPDTEEEEAFNGPIPKGIWTRRWVAHNKKIPEAIIRILAKDSSWRVRDTIAMKRETPPDVLKDLSTDPDRGIRYSVAINKKTPRYILESMLDDPWEEVVLTVKERLGLPTPPPMSAALWVSIKKKQAEDKAYLDRVRLKKDKFEEVMKHKYKIGLTAPSPIPAVLWVSIKKKQAEDEAYLNRVRLKNEEN